MFILSCAELLWQTFGVYVGTLWQQQSHLMINKLPFNCLSGKKREEKNYEK
jgi:hypothetical protein